MNHAATDEFKAQYLRAVFDSIPHPAFIVDEDVRILDFNLAAEPFLGPEPASALHQRGGEALHCLHAGPQGCGKAAHCRDCIIRNSVRKALAGMGVSRELHRAELRTGEGVAPIELLVTTGLLPYTNTPCAMLILEDLSATLALSRD